MCSSAAPSRDPKILRVLAATQIWKLGESLGELHLRLKDAVRAVVLGVGAGFDGEVVEGKKPHDLERRDLRHARLKASEEVT